MTQGPAAVGSADNGFELTLEHRLHFYVVQSLEGLAIGRFARCQRCHYTPRREDEAPSRCPGAVRLFEYDTAAERAEAFGAERVQRLNDWGSV